MLKGFDAHRATRARIREKLRAILALQQDNDVLQKDDFRPILTLFYLRDFRGDDAGVNTQLALGILREVERVFGPKSPALIHFRIANQRKDPLFHRGTAEILSSRSAPSLDAAGRLLGKY